MTDKEMSNVMSLEDIIKFVSLKKMYYGQINNRTTARELSEIEYLLICFAESQEENKNKND